MFKTKSRSVSRRWRAGRRFSAAAGTKTRRSAAHPDRKVVKQAEKIFAGMGMTPAEAVAIFYKQTALHGDFPITELIPNEETQAAIRDARAGIGIKKYASVAEMRADMDSDA